MQWDEDLLNDQRAAASHVGHHARLLAGPGTGKTLTLARRAAYLVTERGVVPGRILALTFTRAAAFELRNRISLILGVQNELPKVSTLHSFALRQLLRNSSRIESLPRPLRIADDWEERNIILEDLKVILSCNLKTIREKFNLLSADWQTLDADEVEWEQRFTDPAFLGAWRQHRGIFAYTLRSELVYQLKRALEQTEEFSLESDYTYLLIDEYQDLNRCDLAVISAIRDRGVEVFGAGDDDQSIYGFRFAHPEGIRRFDRDYAQSTSLSLETCVRCDRAIIDLSLYVANLDPARLQKPLNPRTDAGQGEVHILRFANQNIEAESVASICQFLLNNHQYIPRDILILMRSDRNKKFSSVLCQALQGRNIPVAVRVEGTPLDSQEGRVFLSLLHLLADQNDSLALRTLLMCRDNNIGKESFMALYNLARDQGQVFSTCARRVKAEPGLIPRLGARIRGEIQAIENVLASHSTRFDIVLASPTTASLSDSLQALADEVILNSDKRTEILRFIESVIAETSPVNHIELLRALTSSVEDEEQELDPEKVNIMTMHKAKGLTAKAVIIVAAEDEYIPGRQVGEKEGDEQRLLYVSLSRARHFLIVTYCEHRTGAQCHTGRTSGTTRRSLTRFLRDAPIAPVSGTSFVERLQA